MAQIKQNLAATGTDATGTTSKSLRYEVKQEGSKIILKVIGKPYFMVVETGRKPTPQYTKPSIQFVANIKKWLAVRNASEFSAYGIALSIHKRGTKLWQQGGRKDIVSNVVNEGLSQQIAKELLTKFSQEYIKHAKLVINPS